MRFLPVSKKSTSFARLRRIHLGPRSLILGRESFIIIRTTLMSIHYRQSVKISCRGGSLDPRKKGLSVTRVSLENEEDQTNAISELAIGESRKEKMVFIQEAASSQSQNPRGPHNVQTSSVDNPRWMDNHPVAQRPRRYQYYNQQSHVSKFCCALCHQDRVHDDS